MFSKPGLPIRIRYVKYDFAMPFMINISIRINFLAISYPRITEVDIFLL